MSIYRRDGGEIWWVNISPPSGPRIRQSTGTADEKAAQEFHDRLKAQLWRQEKFGERQARAFEEAAVRFLRACEGQSDYGTKLRHVEYWLGKFKGRDVRSLTYDDISDNLPTHSVHKHKPAAALKGATLNRYVSTIKRMLNLCAEWEWIDKPPRFPAFIEPKKRVRWEPPEVIYELVQALRLPWMKDAAIVAVATGMREGELFGLPPRQVRLTQRTAWVAHDDAKSGRGRTVPLNDDAMEILERRMKTASRLVFTRGERLTARIAQNDRRDLERACKAVGIEDFHWHDLRHTWASWHVQRGTPLMVLKELGGWETIEMVQKYAHLAPSHIAAHAETVTFLAQQRGQAEKTPLDRAA
ncbi:tyrosine-type recombinase/integrase [Bordetella flabilis]|uniref:Integrase n=1 Tax=Bordetella flabilis TaxID=463014 RepID=A0A193GAC4_9BORD|nr:site-specific integrase [Bordetella flabilis]ANN76785.1 integrase [Bordetella flabilis]